MTFNDSFKLILNCKIYLIYCTVKPSTSMGSVSANSTNCGLCTMFKIGSWLNPSMQNPQIRRANCGTRAASEFGIQGVDPIPTLQCGPKDDCIYQFQIRIVCQYDILILIKHINIILKMYTSHVRK